MKIVSGKTLASMAGALVLAFGMIVTGSAQNMMPASGSSQGMMGGMHRGQGGPGDMRGMMSCMHAMQGMQGMRGMQGAAGAPCARVKGMHAIEATVTAADAKTGVVDVQSGGRALKLQFPGLTQDSLKRGDKITVMMAYSKP